MRNSPRLARGAGPVFRVLPDVHGTQPMTGGGSAHDEILTYLVFRLWLERRLRQSRIKRSGGHLSLVPPVPQGSPTEEVLVLGIAETMVVPSAEEEVEGIEIPDVPDDLLDWSKSEYQGAESDTGVFETASPVEDPEDASQPAVERRFRAGWNVLGQYVVRIIDRRARRLQHFIEAKAFEKLAREKRRVRATGGEPVTFEECYSSCRKELAGEVHDLVDRGKWLETPTRDPRDAICMSRAKNRKRVFLLVRLHEEGGGKVLAVYETRRFDRMTHQQGRRGYRNFPPPRH